LNLHQITIEKLHEALMKKQLSSVEVTNYFLNRIDISKHLNAYIDVQPELSLEQAKQADQLIAQGNKGMLTGIPIAHKDVFVTKGWKSTAASKMLGNYQSPFDATVVEKLGILGSGMVCLGKTNMDEFAMGSSNENSAFGPALNPWDSDFVPGGSSGGSAVAVAAGLTMAATGTDTGGSIRQPAAFCGITGIKPTYGRVSRYGMIAYASSLDQAGPMAKTASECAWLMNAIAGKDPRDSTSIERENEDFTRLLATNWDSANSNPSQPLKGLKIGVPKEFFAKGLNHEVKLAIEKALQQFEILGATCVEVSLPKTELSIPVYYVLAPAEASSNLSRYDGVRYGYRSEKYKDLAQMYTHSRTEGFGAEVKRRILVGAYVLSQGYYDAYYLQAQKIRRIIAQDFQTAFNQCDLLMGPVAPDVAWKIGEKSKDPIAMYLEDIFTLSANLAGLPAMSVPCGFNQSGLPIGIQIIGNYFNEAEMLQVADHFQTATEWHLKQPLQNAVGEKS
jgi:aspartyl-tRNA(Asn)/glutamyl-tRNA(Gln) amidotransferase subunit A